MQDERQETIHQLLVHKEKMKYYDEKYEDIAVIPIASRGLKTISVTKAGDVLGEKGLGDDNQL